MQFVWQHVRLLTGLRDLVTLSNCKGCVGVKETRCRSRLTVLCCLTASAKSMRVEHDSTKASPCFHDSLGTLALAAPGINCTLYLFLSSLSLGSLLMPFCLFRRVSISSPWPVATIKDSWDSCDLPWRDNVRKSFSEVSLRLLLLLRDIPLTFNAFLIWQMAPKPAVVYGKGLPHVTNTASKMARKLARETSPAKEDLKAGSTCKRCVESGFHCNGKRSNADACEACATVEVACSKSPKRKL